ncbi:Myb_DNA-bind_3 domain-containing protein [Quillaja saponaria]|uniref:Myb_DNA-bind_3 domain-containing protein n=1 Tax=Quillaja saponaria TaxID=32244 RepID=A0AAD7M696_QUISA|nr:Myb_DNA-bind_3 domain-containing protein [Quillaja saponaria]
MILPLGRITTSYTCFSNPLPSSSQGANGKGAESAKERQRRWQTEQRELRIGDIDEMQANNEIHLDNLLEFLDSIPPSPYTEEATSTTHCATKYPSKGTKRKTPMSAAIADEIREVTGAMKNIANAIVSTNRRVRSKEVAEISKLGLEGWQLIEAVYFILDNDHLVGNFFACPSNIKMDCMLKKMWSI